MVAESMTTFRPRGIGELFDQAIRLYRNNFLKFIGIIAVAEVPLQILQLIVSVLTFGSAMDNLSGAQAPAGESPFSWMMGQLGPGLGGSAIVMILSLVLVQGFAWAALTRAITDSYLGEETGIEGAYSKIGKSWLPLLSALLLMVLLDIPLLIWTVVPCIGWFTGAGILFFVNLVMSMLLAPIVVIERRSGSSALRRAWELARKRFWWMVGYMMLLTLFSLLVINGPTTVLNLVFQSRIRAAGSPGSLYTTQLMIQSLTALVFGLLYQPLQCACAVMAYFDLRVRLEGFDLAIMASQSAEQPVAASEVASQAPSVGNTPLITWPEMGKFALLSLIFVALYFVLMLFVGALGILASGL